MGIDPSDERCIPFYDKMRELDMVYELRRITTLLLCIFIHTSFLNGDFPMYIFRLMISLCV